MKSWAYKGLTLVSLSLMILLLISASVWSAGDKSLVLYYPLDGDTKDASQNSNDGEIQGKSKWVDGKFGAKALHLDPDAWIGITPSDSLNGDFLQGEFSISAWINPNFLGSAWEHIWRSLPIPNGCDTLFINKDLGVISWRGFVGANWTVICQTDGGLIKKDKWYNVTVTSDKKKFRIYLDGKEVKNAAHQETAGKNTIYSFGGRGGETYAGVMDDAGVFLRALDKDEVTGIQEGMEVFLAAEPQGKLTTVWGEIKQK